MAAVTIADVWKYYGKTVAVKELDLEIRDNEFMCILGPSGCGKSSTLRMLAGLEFISAGDIFFDDVRVNDLPPRDRDIAMVFENYALYPHKTVFENMANPLKLRRTPSDEIHRRVHRAAEILEITPLLQRKPMELSGGQKQRTAIGRAIVREPKVFLFDEPIAHLDAKLRSHMRGELKHLQRDLETTTIYVTHDQLEGMSMADRIAVMHDGVLQQLGTPSEIYDSPCNEFVAGFVGEPPMNFLDCSLERTSDGLCVVHRGFRLVLGEHQAAKLGSVSDAGVRIGIRPDNIAIEPGDQGAFDIPGVIYVVEPLGGDMIVEVTVGGDRVMVKSRIGPMGGSGEPCRISLAVDKLHIFDKDTGTAYL